MSALGRRAMVTAAALALAPSLALGLELGAHVSGRGWFFSADGTAQRTDLDALDFDRLKGQPEVRGELVLGRRHHLEASYLRIRRAEEGIVTGTILGIVRFEDQLSLDLSVDDVRARYGYSVVANDWIDTQPFVDVAWIQEETTVVDETLGQRSHQRESGVVPMVGIDLGLLPSFTVHPRVRIEGMATGSGHILDFLVGGEAAYGPAFAGAGYREVDFRVENSQNEEEADVELRGLYVEGGIRF